MKKLFCILMAAGTTIGLFGASAGITPGSYRNNRTVECIGGELNKALFYISANNSLPFKITDFTMPAKPLRLKITFPADVPVRGIYHAHAPNPKFEPLSPEKENTVIDGKAYRIYHYTIPAETVQNRLVKNKYYIWFFLWFDAPAGMDTKFYWELEYDGTLLLKTDNALKSVGAIDSNRPKADSYLVYIAQPGMDNLYLPDELSKERLKHYRKTGYDVIEYIYGNAHRPSGKRALEAKNAGITVAALRGGGFANLMNHYYDEKNFGEKGLVGAMDEFCAKLSGAEDKIFVDFAAPVVNTMSIDWEPRISNNPGYGDKATVAAFAAARGLANLSQEQLKSRYANDYAAFRQEQLCRPIGAIAAIQKKYFPAAPFFVEHGSGLPWQSHGLDYKAIARYADYQLPMIYTSSTIDFFLRSEDMADYIGANKLIPLTELCYSGGLNYRDVDACVMVLLSPALAGCAGVGQWPGLPEMDGGLEYAFWRAKVILAPVIGIFQQGKPAPGLTLQPLPLREKFIQSGSRRIDLSYPQWGASSILRARVLNGEYAIGILNLNDKENLHTRLTVPDLQGTWYLAQPDAGQYFEVSAAALKSGVLLKTPKHSPSVWLLTRDRAKTADMKRLEQKNIEDGFSVEKQTSEKNAGTEAVHLGKVGALTVNYAAVPSGKGELSVLMVEDGKQKIGFSNSGGRIMFWSLNGSGNLVSSDNNIGGFGMDMLWLPQTGRWSGDQIADMTLRSCVNDGKNVRITYEGTMNRSFVGTSLRKTYIISADSPEIKVEVLLRNGNSAEQSTFSYWTHNVLADEMCEFIMLKPDGTFADSSKETSCYPNPKLTGTERGLLGAPGHLREAACPMFGAYDGKAQIGFLFKMPENFLMHYRFTNTADIMFKPVVLNHGQNLSVNYAIEAFRGTPEEFKKQLKETLKNESTQPLRFTTEKATPGAAIELNPELLKISLTGTPARAHLRSALPVKIRHGKKYLFSAEVKLDTLTSLTPKAMSYFYIYNTSNNAHTFLGFTGNGSADWFTVLLPFDADALFKGKNTQPIILVRFNDMNGNVQIRNVSVTELPVGSDIRRGVITSGGKTIAVSEVNIATLSK